MLRNGLFLASAKSVHRRIAVEWSPARRVSTFSELSTGGGDSIRMRDPSHMIWRSLRVGSSHCLGGEEEERKVPDGGRTGGPGRCLAGRRGRRGAHGSRCGSCRRAGARQQRRPRVNLSAHCDASNCRRFGNRRRRAFVAAHFPPRARCPVGVVDEYRCPHSGSSRIPLSGVDVPPRIVEPAGQGRPCRSEGRSSPGCGGAVAGRRPVGGTVVVGGAGRCGGVRVRAIAVGGVHAHRKSLLLPPGPPFPAPLPSLRVLAPG